MIESGKKVLEVAFEAHTERFIRDHRLLLYQGQY